MPSIIHAEYSLLAYYGDVKVRNRLGAGLRDSYAARAADLGRVSLKAGSARTVEALGNPRA